MSKHHKSKRKQNQKHAAAHRVVIEKTVTQAPDGATPPVTKATYSSSFEWWDTVRGEYRTVYATGETVEATNKELLREAIADGWMQPAWWEFWKGVPADAPVKGGTS